MNRSHKIILISHCLLNANSKIRGTALYGTVLLPVIEFLLKKDVGIVQLPCPEHSFAGESRWGQSKDQYNNPFYRNHCRKLIQPVMYQLKDYLEQGYIVLGVVGIKGSPSCGVKHTYKACWGGEMSGKKGEKIFQEGYLAKEPGVFIEVFSGILAEEKIDLPFVEVDEENLPDTLKVLDSLFISQ